MLGQLTPHVAPPQSQVDHSGWVVVDTNKSDVCGTRLPCSFLKDCLPFLYWPPSVPEGVFVIDVAPSLKSSPYLFRTPGSEGSAGPQDTC